MAITIGNTSFITHSNAAATYTLSHNNNGGFLVVAVMGIDNAANAVTFTATYNSVAMDESVNVTATSSSRQYEASIFTLDAPDSGTYDVSITSNPAIVGIAIGAVSLSGEAVSPLGATQTNNAGCSTTLDTTQTNSYIFTASMVRSNVTPPTITAEADQTEVGYGDTGSATTELVGAFYYRACTAIASYTTGGTTAATIGDIAVALEIKELVSAGRRRIILVS